MGTVLILAGALSLLSRYELHTVGTVAMTPTAKAWDDTVIDLDAAGGKGIRRGDMVLVRSGDWAGDLAGLSYTVRIAATGGDTVGVDEQGRITVNDRVVEEPYAHGDNAAFGRFTVKVPDGRVFVLGDARSISVDSRSHLNEADRGTLPLGSIQGQVVAVGWPLQDWSLLSGPAGMTRFPLYLVESAAIVAGVVLELIASWRTLGRWAEAVRSRLPRRRHAKAW
ncbi:signal peptidase I [Kitasatospora sp. NPDC004622]|uniref:signal peptidase I n=1 Tax=Kitasatospora sp. NPDC004622 TaxID=3364018 RepID=UPI0036A1B52B